MALRQRIWAARARLELIDELGGRCVDCGELDVDKLEFDHINGRSWTVSLVETSWRISIYRREAKVGLLRLLCADCNLKRRKTNDNGKWVPSNAVVERTEEWPSL